MLHSDEKLIIIIKQHIYWLWFRIDKEKDSSSYLHILHKYINTIICWLEWTIIYWPERTTFSPCILFLWLCLLFQKYILDFALQKTVVGPFLNLLHRLKYVLGHITYNRNSSSRVTQAVITSTVHYV
jgi:hypothetical protein